MCLDELDRHLEPPPDRTLRLTPSLKRTTAATFGGRRAYTRYSDETKVAAINLYAELRGGHRSRQATDRAVAAQSGIRDRAASIVGKATTLATDHLRTDWQAATSTTGEGEHRQDRPYT